MEGRLTVRRVEAHGNKRVHIARLRARGCHGVGVAGGSSNSGSVGTAQHSCGVGVPSNSGSGGTAQLWCGRQRPGRGLPSPSAGIFSRFRLRSKRSARWSTGRLLLLLCTCCNAKQQHACIAASHRSRGRAARAQQQQPSARIAATRGLLLISVVVPAVARWHGHQEPVYGCTKTLPGRLAVGGTSDAVGNISRGWARPCRLLSGAMSDRKPR
jgi:hypothetical protein